MKGFVLFLFFWEVKFVYLKKFVNLLPLNSNHYLNITFLANRSNGKVCKMVDTVSDSIAKLTPNARKLWKNARKLWKKVGRDEYLISTLKEYNTITETANRNSWKLLCDQVDTVIDVYKIKKIISKSHAKQWSMLRGDNGNNGETIRLFCRETLNMQRHRPKTVTSFTKTMKH